MRRKALDVRDYFEKHKRKFDHQEEQGESKDHPEGKKGESNKESR